MMITNKHADERLIQLVFDPEPNETVIQLPVDQLSFEDIAEAFKLFPSRSQARKNGWQGPAPWGFHQRRCGKRTIWWFNAKPGV